MAFKRYNHLNVPDSWERYFTKYPQGMSILESLFEWVSQVDSMVDNQNKLSANVEQFRNEIDEFVGRFDERIQTEVSNTLTDWQTSGFLDVVISEALQWQLDDYIATNEQDKLSLTTQLQQKATILQYSQLGSLDALEQALLAGSSVDIDDDIILDRKIIVKNQRLYSSNGSVITLPNNNAEIEVQNNGYFYVDVTQSEGYRRINPAVSVTSITNNDGFTFNMNGYIGAITVTLLDAAVGVEIRSDYLGLWGVTLEGTHIYGADKNISLKLTTSNSWITGCNFNDVVSLHCKHTVFTEDLTRPNSLSLGDRISNNVFRNLRSQTNDRTVQHVVDHGNNIYQNSEFFDLNRHNFPVPNKNKFSLSQNANNYGVNRAPVLSGASFISFSQLNRNYRIGYFKPLETLTESYVTLEFVGPIKSYGRVFITMGTGYVINAEFENRDLSEVFDLFVISNDDNVTYSVFMKYKGGNANINGWVRLSYYESNKFIIEPDLTTVFLDDALTAHTKIAGTVTVKNEKPLFSFVIQPDLTLSSSSATNILVGETNYNRLFSFVTNEIIVNKKCLYEIIVNASIKADSENRVVSTRVRVNGTIVDERQGQIAKIGTGTNYTTETLQMTQLLNRGDKVTIEMVGGSQIYKGTVIVKQIAE